MKSLRRAVTLSLIAWLAMGIPLSGLTADVGKRKSVSQKTNVQDVKQTKLVRPIVYRPKPYKPPLVGAPQNRVGGGTRGYKAFPRVSILAPDHIGLTTRAQPVLYWYLERPTSYALELTVRDDQSTRPLLETRLIVPAKPGIQGVRLADYGIRLTRGVPYRWFVALVFDRSQRSQDILAEGAIEYRERSVALREQLAKVDKGELPRLYAEAGFWYDAFDAVSELIDAAPDDRVLRRQRAALLKQVDLHTVAAFDTQSTK